MGDKEAELVLKAMGYQISKEIYSMAAVLEGKADAVVLTGHLCKADTSSAGQMKSLKTGHNHNAPPTVPSKIR